MSDSSQMEIEHLDTSVEDLSDEQLAKHYADLDDLVGWGGKHIDDAELHSELHERMMEAWREMESRNEDIVPECPECGTQHWTYEVGGGPVWCASCDYTPGPEEADLQIEVCEVGGLIHGRSA